jgi:hypothetical protein
MGWRREADGDAAAAQIARLAHRLLQLIHAPQHQPGPGQQFLPGIGEREAGPAMQQKGAAGTLQPRQRY